jgi:hypothetical protein
MKPTPVLHKLRLMKSSPLDYQRQGSRRKIATEHTGRLDAELRFRARVMCVEVRRLISKKYMRITMPKNREISGISLYDGSRGRPQPQVGDPRPAGEDRVLTCEAPVAGCAAAYSPIGRAGASTLPQQARCGTHSSKAASISWIDQGRPRNSEQARTRLVV